MRTTLAEASIEELVLHARQTRLETLRLLARLQGAHQATADLLVMCEVLYNAISYEVQLIEIRQGRSDAAILLAAPFN